MKKDIPFTIGDLPIANPVQERIKLLNDNDFLVHEIAALSGLRKKLINKITKGKYLPVGKERDKLCEILDELIARLNITEATFYDGPCPEADLDTTDYNPINVVNEDLLLYKSARDKKIVCTVNKIIYGLSEPEATMNIRKDGRKLIMIIRGDINPNLILPDEK